MRLVLFAAAIVVAAGVLGSCGDDSAGGAPAPESRTTTAEASSSDLTIPDGTYSKTVTKAQARALGVTDADFLRELGKDGRSRYVFKFAGERWTMFVVEAGSAPEPGDLGTLEYDDKGVVAMVSESVGCPGCVLSYDWRLTGDRLSLALVGQESIGEPEDVAEARFVTEGDFTRQP